MRANTPLECCAPSAVGFSALVFGLSLPAAPAFSPRPQHSTALEHLLRDQPNLWDSSESQTRRKRAMALFSRRGEGRKGRQSVGCGTVRKVIMKRHLTLFGRNSKFPLVFLRGVPAPASPQVPQRNKKTDTMEERPVKPKMTKAQRRAVQEAQRAAKASAKMGGEQGAGAPTLPGIKPAQANTPTPASAGQVGSYHILRMS